MALASCKAGSFLAGKEMALFDRSDKMIEGFCFPVPCVPEYRCLSLVIMDLKPFRNYCGCSSANRKRWGDPVTEHGPVVSVGCVVFSER